MSYELYKILHLVGIVTAFAAVGGVAAWGMNGRDKRENQARGLLSALHGIALFVVLVAGFGLLAKLGMAREVPGWAWGKIAVWFLLGGSLALASRPGLPARLALGSLPVLGGLGAWLAVAKPGGLGASSGPSVEVPRE